MFSHGSPPKRIQGGFSPKINTFNLGTIQTIQPKRENPILGFPVLEKPEQEKPAQLNTNILNMRIKS